MHKPGQQCSTTSTIRTPKEADCANVGHNEYLLRAMVPLEIPSIRIDQVEWRTTLGRDTRMGPAGSGVHYGHPALILPGGHQPAPSRSGSLRLSPRHCEHHLWNAGFVPSVPALPCGCGRIPPTTRSAARGPPGVPCPSVLASPRCACTPGAVVTRGGPIWLLAEQCRTAPPAVHQEIQKIYVRPNEAVPRHGGDPHDRVAQTRDGPWITSRLDGTVPVF
mmetsp:Transcript_47208/g.77608  ORF Transcript_47208/g.77608 Transcript_47208/m.77608 type:complete len:220 (-) Transcript_47208:1158-1817(-)